MTLPALMRTLRARNIRVEASGDRLRVRGSREALTPELEQAIHAHSTALHLAQRGRLRPCTDLYRFVGRGDRVRTPYGEASVLQVFADRLTVQVVGEEHARFIHPGETEKRPDEGTLIPDHEIAPCERPPAVT